MVKCKTIVIRRNYYAEDTFLSTSSVILSHNLYFITTNVFEKMTFVLSAVYREGLLVRCSYNNNNNNNNNNTKLLCDNKEHIICGKVMLVHIGEKLLAFMQIECLLKRQRRPVIGSVWPRGFREV
jgi:hypothetical protein